MGTYTAQILVGQSHQNDGGIVPNDIRQIFLFENDQPRWVMNEYGRKANSNGNPADSVCWVPESVETMLEDGLLFVALHVMRHEDLFAHAPKELTSLDTPRVCLREIPAERLSRLRTACRSYDFGGKGQQVLILSALAGSTILSQLPVIDEYHFDCEILTPKYSRSFSKWTGSTKTSGSLG